MKNTVCLNMIVKNEREVIERCLSSVKQLIDYWIIVDTGSTDGTQEVVKKFLKDIPGELHERPWVDFGYNRNEAMKLAEGKTDYLFFIDADDRLVFSDDFCLPPKESSLWMIVTSHGPPNWFGCASVHQAPTPAIPPPMMQTRLPAIVVISRAVRRAACEPSTRASASL